MAELSWPQTCAALAIATDLITYTIYIRSIFRRESKPHVFSWFVWGIVIAIGAAAQLKLGAGPSAWVLAFVAAVSFLISALALFVGEKRITRSDWAALAGSLLAIILWQITSNPLIALYSIIAIDCLSYWPTVRKSWLHPGEESAKAYFCGGLGYLFTLLAVPDMRIETLFYPFFLMATDWGFMGFLLWRRRTVRI